MPVAGLVRLRKHQFGRQDVFGTKVAPTRAYAFQGTPDVDLTWTDSEVDAGSIVTTIAPQRGTGTFTAGLTDPQLPYNTLPLLAEGVFGGNVDPTGGGTAKTWVHEPSAVAPLDDASLFTYEFFDDTVAREADQLGDGILDSVTITIPEGLGAVTTSMNWRFGSAANQTSTDSPPSPAITTSLSVPPNEALVYGKDLSVYLASSAAGLDSGQITGAFHGGTITISQTNDDKRFADGTQTFDVSERSRTGLAVEYALTWAKTDDIIGTGSESDAWFSDDAVDRYIRLKFESTLFAEGATPYSWLTEAPIRYYTRTHGDSAGNAIVVLTGHAWYDPGSFAGFFKSTIVNTLDAAALGSAGS